MTGVLDGRRIDPDQNFAVSRAFSFSIGTLDTFLGFRSISNDLGAEDQVPARCRVAVLVCCQGLPRWGVCRDFIGEVIY